MGKRHGASGHQHQNTEDFFYATEGAALQHFVFKFDATEIKVAVNNGNNADSKRNQ